MRAMLMLAALTLAAPNREPAGPTLQVANTPQHLLLGDWLDETAPNRAMVLRIRPNESEFMVGGQTSVGDGLTATYAIDWSANPVAIDFMPRQQSAKLSGILKLEGDRLTLGLQTNGGSRPTDFSKATLVLRYRRLTK